MLLLLAEAFGSCWFGHHSTLQGQFTSKEDVRMWGRCNLPGFHTELVSAVSNQCKPLEPLDLVSEC